MQYILSTSTESKNTKMPRSQSSPMASRIFIDTTFELQQFDHQSDTNSRPLIFTSLQKGRSSKHVRCDSFSQSISASHLSISNQQHNQKHQKGVFQMPKV